MTDRTREIVCTSAAPYSPSERRDGQRVVHPDAKCVWDGGWEQEFERYEWPHCGTRFTVELSQ